MNNVVSDLDIYQKQAMSFRLPTADARYTLLNLSAEVGELHSLVAKGIRDGYDPGEEAVMKELGDVLWHVAAIAQDYGWPLSDVAWGNIFKLSERKRKGTLQGSGDNR